MAKAALAGSVPRSVDLGLTRRERSAVISGREKQHPIRRDMCGWHRLLSWFWLLELTRDTEVGAARACQRRRGEGWPLQKNDITNIVLCIAYKGSVGGGAYITQ